MEESHRERHGILHTMVVHIQTRIGAGLLVTLPIGITILILKFVFDLLDPLLQPLLAFLPGPKIPGLGLVTLLLVVYLTGLITTHVVGRRLIDQGHRIIEFIPGVKGIYSTTRSAVQMLGGSKDRAYRGVVLVEFPTVGKLSIGLITGNMGVKDGLDMVSVYIPTTPVPSSGFLVVMPLRDVLPLDLSVEDAMKIVISGGILSKNIFNPRAPHGGQPVDEPVPGSAVPGTREPEPVTVPVAVPVTVDDIS